MINQVL